MYLKQFGGSIKKKDLERYQQSPNWKEGSFQNLEQSELTPSIWKIPSMIYKQIAGKKEMFPPQPIPIETFDMDAFLAPSDEAKFIWYGHAVVLIRMNGKTLLIDPMLGPDTTPIVPSSSLRFSENTLSLIDDFPPIDLVLFTHDHYDHLDFASIQKLQSKVKHFYVALGVKRHLECWGITSDIVTEFDWWDRQVFHDIEITFTPTRHFSGRGLTDRLKSLWGGWAFRSQNENIWFSGDGGYGSHFKEIGKRLGPFDFAFMECGQYNEDWRAVHMFPDESVKAAIDARVDKIMPFHCAGFSLSYQHSWSEPLEEFVQAAKAQDIPFSIPPLGRFFTKSSILHDEWWESIK